MRDVSNVTPINGMAHLIEAANQKPEPQPKQTAPEFPKGKVLKMRCILEGVDYYIPEGDAGIQTDEPPYCPFAFSVGYSVLPQAVGQDPIVIKHSTKRFYQTGISTEIVDEPKWWSRRDEGI